MPDRTSARAGIADELVFRSEELDQLPEGLHVGNLDPLADDAHVLLFAQALDVPTHRVDIEANAARKLHRRHGDLGAARRATRKAKQRRGHLELTVTQEHDLDLLFRLPEAADELLDDAQGYGGVVLDEGTKRGGVEGQHDAIDQGDGGGVARPGLKECRFAEEIARANQVQASIHEANTLEDSHPTVLEEKGLLAGLALAKDRLAGFHLAPKSGDEPVLLSGS